MKIRILGIILAFAGLSIIIYGLYIRYDTLNTQQRIISQFENMVEDTIENAEQQSQNFLDDVNNSMDNNTDNVVENVEHDNNATNNSNTDNNDTNNSNTDNIEERQNVLLAADDGLLQIEGINVIGVMEIPKIDLRVAVAEGTDKQTLKKAVGHFEGTAMPGETGNFAVAGHRSYTYNEFFNRLDEMEIGDEIIVKTAKGKFVYEVTDIFVVEPHEVWVLDPTPEATITLVTCTPIRVATHRLIVKGKLKN